MTLGGSTDKKPLAVRAFDERMKKVLYTKQTHAAESYNRSTTAGKRSGVNLCLFPLKQRITVNPVQLPRD